MLPHPPCYLDLAPKLFVTPKLNEMAQRKEIWIIAQTNAYSENLDKS